MWLAVGGVSGLMAVALGAFGAHGLKSKLGALDDFSARMGWWSTASEYHLAHSLFLLLVGLLVAQGKLSEAPLRIAGASASIGLLLFSGSLYAMALTGVRALGAITPLGGIAFLIAWGSLAYSGWQAS